MSASPPPGIAGLSLPPPLYTVRLEKSAHVLMRDGLKLATDLYFPAEASGPLPVILVRTPYGKNEFRPGSGSRYEPVTQIFPERGYVVAVQDGRGRFESAAPHRISVGDALDGYDTIEWLARQPWSNGRVGTYGCSHRGEMQLYTARTAPPSLKAMIPQSAGTAAGSARGAYNLMHEPSGGAFPLAVFKWYVEWGTTVFWTRPHWIDDQEYRRIADYFDPRPKIPALDYDVLLRTLPVTALPDRVPVPPLDFAEMVRRRYDVGHDWWRQFDFVSEGDPTGAPALLVESWHDCAPRDTLYLREMYSRTGVDATTRTHQFAIITPACHCDNERLTRDFRVGERELGDAHLDLYALYLRWFDRWLKQEENGIESMPRIHYFVMGRNRWRAADEWPPPGVRFEKLYLSSGGAANGCDGDGRLAFEPPPSGAQSDSFTYDPADPVPSRGESWAEPERFVVDQRPVSARNDVLVYTSAPFEDGIEITGPLDVHLSVSSSAPDTDFVAKLNEVLPDGRVLNIREAILRARFREGRERQVLMTPGEVYGIRIDLQATSIFIPAGHRLQLFVTSSSFPRWDRNLNTGGLNCDESLPAVARNTVHHSREHPSYVLLPVAPD